MVAEYKRRRHLVEKSIDWKPKAYDLEGSEREESKRNVRLELIDLDSDESIARELWENAMMKQASECYAAEEANPDNYECTCERLEISDFMRKV